MSARFIPVLSAAGQRRLINVEDIRQVVDIPAEKGSEKPPLAYLDIRGEPDPLFVQETIGRLDRLLAEPQNKLQAVLTGIMDALQTIATALGAKVPR